MHFRLDQLGKNILRDFFMLVGAVETEVEVPPGDAQRIDLWHVPDPERLSAHPEIEPGLLRSMASEQGMVELWSAAPDTADFHGCLRKRYAFHHTLELRAERPLPPPFLWFVSAGRPDSVLRDFGFVPAPKGPEGLYTTLAPGWRIYVVVIAELPRVRSTVLLRLLGGARVRRLAMQDLAELPEEAWERHVALPWLVRLSFEVPVELVPSLPAEEREFIMEARQWFEQKLKEAEERGRERGLERGFERGLERGHLQKTLRLYGLRLGRPLTETERAILAERLSRLGEDRIDEVMLALSAEALAAWLADPNAS